MHPFSSFWKRIILFISCALLSTGFVYFSKIITRQYEDLDEEYSDDEEDCTLVYNKKRNFSVIGDTGDYSPLADYCDFSGPKVALRVTEEHNGQDFSKDSPPGFDNSNGHGLNGIDTNVVLEAISINEKPILEFATESASPLFWVPDEIYLHVFSYLSAVELNTVPTVCKDWGRLVDDHALWRALVHDLCDDSGVPFNLCAGDSDSEFSLQSVDEPKKHSTWKQRYYVASGLQAHNEAKALWRTWLDLMLETTTHAVILGHNLQVYAISDKIKPSVVDLDDIFKGIGVKGSFPIPRIVHLCGKTFTVLSTLPHNWSLGFWMIARDLRTDTGLVIVKTRKLVLISLKERCDFCGQIEMVQGTLRAAELLMTIDY